MFLIKRAYFNKTNIIKGLLVAILFSAFIYLAHFEIYNKTINSIFALISLYYILKASKSQGFYLGFFIGIFWFYWVSISLQYYEVTYLAPLSILLFAVSYGLFFYIICYFESTLIRVILIYLFSYFHPLGFNWFIPELIFVDSYFSIQKEHFALILASIYMVIKLSRYKLLALLPLVLALDFGNQSIQMPNIKIDMPKFNVKQEQKWLKGNLSNLVEQNLEIIDNSIKNENELVILPETAFPILLNKEHFIMDALIEKSYKIDILLGSLYYEDDSFYNATYYFSKGNLQIAKKFVLVPFGEEIPFPKIFVDLINDIFYNGAQDYKKALSPTDFEIKGEKFRNAICYEATSDKIFENLDDTKYMIAISNNAWFTPSIEPTLQKLLLKYYAKKYNIIIYHQVNGSENYIIKP